MVDLTLLAGAGLAVLFIIGLTIYITSSINGAVNTLIKSNKNLTSKLYYINNTLNDILFKINFLKQEQHKTTQLLKSQMKSLNASISMSLNKLNKKLSILKSLNERLMKLNVQISKLHIVLNKTAMAIINTTKAEASKLNATLENNLGIIQKEIQKSNNVTLARMKTYSAEIVSNVTNAIEKSTNKILGAIESSTKTTLNAINIINITLNNMMSLMNETINENKEVTKELRNTIAEMKKEVGKSLYQMNMLNKELTKTSKELKSTKQDIESLKKDIEELKVRLNTTSVSLEKKVNILNDIVKGLTKDVSGIRGQITLLMMVQLVTLIAALGAIGLILMRV